ncbi:MAG: hypothetical protein EXQ85_03130 [Alphaproteobacteria bacterium]|nr:hypothetical protein [Alphaproteobacteria bacterium]
MVRALLTALPFLLPFAAYGIYLFVGRKKPDAPSWHDAPWVTLIIVGLALLIASLGATALIDGTKPGTRYEPARIEGGRIVPPPTR